MVSQLFFGDKTGADPGWLLAPWLCSHGGASQAQQPGAASLPGSRPQEVGSQASATFLARGFPWGARTPPSGPEVSHSTTDQALHSPSRPICRCILHHCQHDHRSGRQ